MNIIIQVENSDDPRAVEKLAQELRSRFPIHGTGVDVTPKIDVEYPSGRRIKF